MILKTILKIFHKKLPEWGEVSIPLRNIVYFKILSSLRKVNQKYFKKQTEKNSLEGTIYGDIQRDQLRKS